MANEEWDDVGNLELAVMVRCVDESCPCAGLDRAIGGESFKVMTADELYAMLIAHVRKFPPEVPDGI